MSFTGGIVRSKKTFVFVNPTSTLQSGGNIYNAHIIHHLKKAGHSVYQTKDIYAKEFLQKNYIILLDSIILDEKFDTGAFEEENAYFLIHLWPSNNVDITDKKKVELMEKQREVCQKFKLIFAGAHALHQCQSFYSGQLRPYKIIPPGVTSGWKTKKIFAEAASKFLMVGNISRRKRQLDVANWFVKSHLPIHLSLVGRCDEYTYIDQIHKLTHIFPDKVSWYSEIDYHKINDFMVDFDAIILFSQEENNSIALLESIASGIPMITTPTGNHIAFRKHQVGFVLESFDIEDLSRVVHKMHTDSKFYQQHCDSVKNFTVNSWEESSSLFLHL